MELSSPEATVCIEVIKNVCCIGVLTQWQRFKEYNLRATAGEVTTRIVAAYPAECEADAAACAGWTTMDAERV